MTTLLNYILLITSPYPYFNSFSDHYSAAAGNILMISGRITEHVNVKSRMQE